MEMYYRELYDFVYYSDGRTNIAEVKTYYPYELMAYIGMFIEIKNKEKESRGTNGNP